jgi:hypothetical protein
LTHAHALDARILAAIHLRQPADDALGDAAFERLALDLFAYQIETNGPYGRYAAARGYSASNMPAGWRDIPAVPSAAFKEATLATFDVRYAERIFRTSGTTSERTGLHYLERAYLYDEALLAGFDRFMLPDGATLRYLNLVPDPRFNRQSSLGYMMGHVSVLRGDGKAAWFLEDDAVDSGGFVRAMQAAIAEQQPVCIAGTAFAFASLIAELAQAAIHLEAPAGSRIMETGGFKGRTRSVDRGELYARLEHALGIPQHAIVAEYGMTELCSQYYDTLASRTQSIRVKAAPPWLRTLVVDGAGNEVPPGETGYLRHVDLANRSSAIAVETEDRGYLAAGGLVLLGRDEQAPPRGCSLDAEDLIARR